MKIKTIAKWGVKWGRIIIEILILIGEGLSKDKAVSQVAKKFGVPESEIWKHGGF